MDAGSLALVLACMLLWAVLSAKAQRAYLSAPMVFVTAGWLLAQGLDAHPGHEAVKVVAETTLVWVLFADASRVKISKFRSDAALYVRLLGVKPASDGRARSTGGDRAAPHGTLDCTAPRRRSGTD